MYVGFLVYVTPPGESPCIFATTLTKLQALLLLFMSSYANLYFYAVQCCNTWLILKEKKLETNG